MKPLQRISVLFILILISTNLLAQNSNCNLKKTLPVKMGTTLTISNKYGDINVVTGKEDSLIICSTITIIQDDNNLIDRSMKLIKINIDKIKDTIFAATSYDRKFFSDTYREGRKRFSVDYLIKMPAYMNLNITDEFGNIMVDELSGALNVKLSQGFLNAKNLTRGNIKPLNTLVVDHSKINIDNVNWMALTIVNCPTVNIKNARALMINSVISKIRLGNISSLVSNSKSDSYNINSITNFVSESTYSEYEIGRLDGRLISKATYGSINILDLDKWFSGIDITASQSEISLITPPDISFTADIIATDVTTDIPAGKFKGITRTVSNFSTTLLGTAGKNRNPEALIKIRLTSGKLSIQ